MLTKEGEPITASQRATLVRELLAYRDRNLINGKPLSWAKIGREVGRAGSVLSEWSRGLYKGDDDKICRMVDAFLAKEDHRASGPNLRDYAALRVVVEVMESAVAQAELRRTIAVITGEPGSGKSIFCRHYVDRHEGAVLLTCDDSDRDAKFIIDGLHAGLRLGTYCRYAREKKREIEAYLQAHKNTIVFIDESQKLTPDALETLRLLHDKSDPEGIRNVPIVLVGDHTFYKTVTRSRGGERTPISPQITSRMFPVVSLERHGLEHDDDGQVIPDSVYSVADIEAVLKQSRLRLFRPEALAWAARLANVSGYGRLRLVVRVAEISVGLKRGAQVTIDDLRAAMEVFLAPRCFVWVICVGGSPWVRHFSLWGQPAGRQNGAASPDRPSWLACRVGP